jgi:ribosomal protein S18 acetylase RimI-like enzyme
MMDMPQIRSASEAERERVIQTIVLGFASDPLCRWFWPEAGVFLEAMPRFVEAFGGAAFNEGSAYTTDGFTGAALWLPPGTGPDEETAIAILEETIGPEISDDMMKFFGLMDEYHPNETCWYLPLIAVDPAYQARGLGSALMKYALRRCDEEGLTAYLESSNPQNISLYERHGFEICAQIQVGSSPVAHPMIRSPKA